MLKKYWVIIAIAFASVVWFMQQASAEMLSISGSQVTVTTEWVTKVNESATALLTTVFEILKFLPVIALIIWGFYLLNKIFWIVKSAGSGGSK